MFHSVSAIIWGKTEHSFLQGSDFHDPLPTFAALTFSCFTKTTFQLSCVLTTSSESDPLRNQQLVRVFSPFCSNLTPTGTTFGSV